MKERAEKQREEKENLLKALAEKESFKKKEPVVVNAEPAEKIAEVRVIRSTSQGKPEANSDRVEKSPIKQEEESYNDDGFEKEEESYNYEQEFEKVDDEKQSRLQEQIQKVKQDFEENEEEEEIYKKEEPERPKTGGKKKKKK